MFKTTIYFSIGEPEVSFDKTFDDAMNEVDLCYTLYHGVTGFMVESV